MYISFDGFNYIPFNETVARQMAERVRQNLEQQRAIHGEKIIALQAAASFMNEVGADLHIRTNWNGEMPYGQG